MDLLPDHLIHRATWKVSSPTFVERHGADDGHRGAAVGRGCTRPRTRPRNSGSSAGCPGWLKALKLAGYGLRRPSRRLALQRALLPYLEAL